MPVTPLDDRPLIVAPSGTITRAPVTSVNASIAVSSGPGAISNRKVALAPSRAESGAPARDVTGVSRRQTSSQGKVREGRNAGEDMFTPEKMILRLSLNIVPRAYIRPN